MITKFLDSVERFLHSDQTDVETQFRSLAHAMNNPQPAPLTDSPLSEDTRMSDTLAGTAEAERHLDSLPFGAFLLDKSGTVLRYNDTETKIHGMPREAVGQNMFTEIAPCTRRPEFLGVFLDGVQKKNLNALFNYEFTFKGSSTRVWVCMKNDPHKEDQYWIFFKRL
jgi:photoactive yellow protein